MIGFSRDLLDGSLLFLGIMGLVTALLTMHAVRSPDRTRRSSWQEYGEPLAALVAALLLTATIGISPPDLIPGLALFVVLALVLRASLRRLSMAGVMAMATRLSVLVVAAAWGVMFLREASLPAWLEIGACAGLALSLLLAGAGLLESFAREALLTHARWARPNTPPALADPRHRPKVSLQLPCYAEPPEVVKATMNRLAALDYDNFEVLVCDNNTKDEALWRPLEEHCRALNRRLGRQAFRFFHVAPLEGAKAGALNFLLGHMAPDAELIGLVDADYFSQPDFLSRLVPCFEDPGVGYVQTPHDYRGHKGSSYLTACYWEYMPANKIDWPGVSEYGGAFTIGTMCLLRTEALRAAGGWAEWCLTEDSEVSVRLRAAGYHGYYFAETFGRGLIPDTFEDYKKQRFRWTAGPVQQLRRHWRLFLPAPFAPALPGWTKGLEIARCITPLMRLAAIVTGVIGTAAMGAALATGAMQPLDLPDVVWALFAIGLATTTVQTVHRYRLSGCTRLVDMIRGEIARASLTYVVLVAGIAGLSSRPLAWRRTPKFAVAGADGSAFADTMPETIAGIACTVLATLVAFSADLWGTEVALLMALGYAGMAVSFFCAPVMAAMGIDHANRAADKQTRATVLTPDAWPRPVPPPAKAA